MCLLAVWLGPCTVRRFSEKDAQKYTCIVMDVVYDKIYIRIVWLIASAFQKQCIAQQFKHERYHMFGHV